MKNQNIIIFNPQKKKLSFYKTFFNSLEYRQPILIVEIIVYLLFIVFIVNFT